ncbi:30S ribosomal protein S18 [Patescibacteria group bacterium]
MYTTKHNRKHNLANCYFCTSSIRKIDYKDMENISKFIDAQAKIIKKKETGLCVKHQKRLTQAVKRARFMAFLPFVR